MLWADARPRRLVERVGLAVTLLAGAAALLRAGLAARPARDRLGVAAGGLLLAFAWAQGWAVYALIQAPDLFLGGVTLERLFELPAHALFAEPWRRTLQTLLLAAGLAAFLASSLALREPLRPPHPTRRRPDRPQSGLLGRPLRRRPLPRLLAL